MIGQTQTSTERRKSIMSSCLILQAKDKLYIGADTSSSVFINDKLYRLNNNT